MTDRGSRHEWPGASLARVPYWVYQDDGNYRAELRRIFEGPVWNYLCLDSDVPKAGDYRTSFLGEMPVIVVRGAHERDLRVREPLRPPRRADRAGRQRVHRQPLPVRLPRLDLRPHGDLVGIAFEKGINGKGGMPASFCKADHGPRKLRITVLAGLVFGSSQPTTCRPSRSTWATRCWAASSACCTSRRG